VNIAKHMRETLKRFGLSPFTVTSDQGANYVNAITVDLSLSLSPRSSLLYSFDVFQDELRLPVMKCVGHLFNLVVNDALSEKSTKKKKIQEPEDEKKVRAQNSAPPTPPHPSLSHTHTSCVPC